jgi:hypothetical protein
MDDKNLDINKMCICTGISCSIHVMDDKNSDIYRYKMYVFTTGVG